MTIHLPPFAQYQQYGYQTPMRQGNGQAFWNIIQMIDSNTRSVDAVPYNPGGNVDYEGRGARQCHELS
ncbi:MAG TPA: hypothetical protein VKT80_19475 [Chloroflexota bacterium]|nr:hypothetical protein [Chloroflexota bacterium]